MDLERWEQVEEVFQSALDQPLDQRAAFLDEACAGDAALREQVEALIASYEKAGDFIEEPVFGAMQTNITGPVSDSTLAMIGRRIGSYKVVRELGRGGMGAVYLAVRADDVFQKRVAIKLVKRGMDTDFIIRRFRHERQILANLDHPNIARILDGGTTEDGLPYFVMEFVEGRPIHHYCDLQNLPIAERLRLFRRVCSAVHYAHQHQIIHRDIKPGNILVTDDATPKLLDFGIAKLLNPELALDTIDPTATAVRLMTPEYASPEQVRGEAATVSSDVYSLGVLLYELLTGHRPYILLSRLPHEAARIICEENPVQPSIVINRADGILLTDGIRNQSVVGPDSICKCRRVANLEELRRQFSGNLDNIIMKALHKEPEQRYRSVEEFSEDIRRHLEGASVSAPLYFVRPNRHREASTGAPATTGKSIAVLPLKMLHGAKADRTTDDYYLGLGLADALITRLSNIRKIMVRPTSSVAHYANEDTDPFAAGRALSVDYILDGRIQKAGDRIRVTVQLVSLRDAAPLWASQFNEKYTDILSIQDSISEQVAEALMPRLTGEEREQLTKRGTDNPKAYEAYLRGRYYANGYTEEGLAKSITHFYEAIAIDPTFAAAYTGIADYHLFLGIWGVLPPKECFIAAKDAASKAVELGPTLAEAYTSLAMATWSYDWDSATSERLFKRAIELNPNYSLAHERYAYFLGAVGRHDESIKQIKHALKIDPQSPTLISGLGYLLYNARSYDEARDQLLQALEVDPNYYPAIQGLGIIHALNGRHKEAIATCREAVRVSGPNPFTVSSLGSVLGTAGQHDEACEVIKKLLLASSSRYVSPYFIAQVYTAINEFDKAVEFIHKAIDERDWWTHWIRVAPLMDPLRSNPRFQEILKLIDSREKLNNATATTIIDPRFTRVLPDEKEGGKSEDDDNAIASTGFDTFADAHNATTSEKRGYIEQRRASLLSWPYLMAAVSIIILATAGAFLYVKIPFVSVNQTEGGLTRLTNHTATDLHPDWSPDGARIAFASNRDGTSEIYVMNLDGSSVQRLTYNTADDDVPAWSPDGQKIAFQSKRDGNVEFYVMNADGSNQINLSKNAAVDGRASWSPDGKRLVFASNQINNQNNFDIYIINSDGSGLKKLTEDPGFDGDPSWSPDGTKIAFASNRDQKSFEIYVMNIDGSNVRSLSNNPANDTKPVWSPDGKRISFSSHRSTKTDAPDIYIMDSDGTNQQLITDNPTFDDEPSWSPDGQRIAFQTDRDGNFEIYAVEISEKLKAHQQSTGAKPIVVLPFANEGATDDSSSGLALSEALISRLSQAREVVVRRPTGDASEMDAANVQNVQQIGSQLNVDYAITGSESRAGDTLSVTASLISVRDGSILWVGKYTETISDLSSTQATIADRIAKDLRLELASAERRQLADKYINNNEAYQLYLAGRYYLSKRTPMSIKQAISSFEQAIKLDQNYAPAYAGLADCYALHNWYITPSPPDTFKKAKEAATRAVQLDDNLAEAHASLAFIRVYYEHDWAGAESEFKRAIELYSGYATAHHWYALLLSATGRHDEALAEIKRALELDSRSLIINTALANVHYYARRYDQAIEQCLKTLEMDSGFMPAYKILRTAYTAKGMYNEAFNVYQREKLFSENSPDLLARLGEVYAASGKREEAEKLVNELRRTQPNLLYEAAVVYALLDNKDEAINLLEKANEARSIGSVYIKVEPLLDNLRSDPRFNSLLQRTKLAE